MSSDFLLIFPPLPGSSFKRGQLCIIFGVKVLGKAWTNTLLLGWVALFSFSSFLSPLVAQVGGTVIVFVCVIVKVWKMCLPWLLGWVALQINRRISGFLDFQQKLSLLDRPCPTLAYTVLKYIYVAFCTTVRQVLQMEVNIRHWR